MLRAKFIATLILPLLLSGSNLFSQAQTPVCPPYVAPSAAKASKTASGSQPARTPSVPSSAVVPVSATLSTAVPGAKGKADPRSGTVDPVVSAEPIENPPADPASAAAIPALPVSSSSADTTKPAVSEVLSERSGDSGSLTGVSALVTAIAPAIAPVIAPAIAPAIAAAGRAGFVQLPPPPVVKKNPETVRPFGTYAVGLKFDTLGAGVEIATPLSHSFNLRSSTNFLGFSYPFSIDGINYNAELHFRSQQVNVDWFPERRGSFHVSVGIIYLRNNLSAVASVQPGHYFELGDQGFTNSVDDPLSGTATVVYPHTIAPTLMMGFSNMLPRSGKHFSMPYEFGVAYTGAPRIDVQLSGTACTAEGCFNAATNKEMQQSLQQENAKLNNSLSGFPVYPIVSLGLAYRF